jgi:hypothetical protein
MRQGRPADAASPRQTSLQDDNATLQLTATRDHSSGRAVGHSIGAPSTANAIRQAET